MELCTQKFKLESHCTAIYNWKGEQVTDLLTGIFDIITLGLLISFVKS